MSDLIVHDHSKECRHGFRVGHMPGDGLEWCPGGREIVLEHKTVADFYKATGYVASDEFWTQQVWIEVSDD